MAKSQWESASIKAPGSKCMPNKTTVWEEQTERFYCLWDFVTMCKLMCNESQVLAFVAARKTPCCCNFVQYHSGQSSAHTPTCTHAPGGLLLSFSLQLCWPPLCFKVLRPESFSTPKFQLDTSKVWGVEKLDIRCSTLPTHKTNKAPDFSRTQITIKYYDITPREQYILCLIYFPAPNSNSLPQETESQAQLKVIPCAMQDNQSRLALTESLTWVFKKPRLFPLFQFQKCITLKNFSTCLTSAEG